MDKIFEIIWWPITVAVIPLDAGFIIRYICEESFGIDFWTMTVLYILLCVCAGSRLHLIEKEGRK